MAHFSINKTNLVVAIILFIIASAFILSLSPTTSVLYPYKQMMVDEAVFFTIGKYWLKDGTLPYVGLWDLKGPITYVLNGIGFLIFHNIKGVSIIQIIFLTFSTFFTYRFYKLKYKSAQSLLLSIASLLCLSLDYEGGDCVEEFILPLLLLSYYFIYKWINEYNVRKCEHNEKYAIVYGLVLGFSLLTRLTNALGVMGGVTYICFVLLFNKKWKNLFANAEFFILGFSLITLPFFIYFWVHGALYEMWYGTILYNIEYAKNSVGGHSVTPLFTIYIYGTALLLYGFYLMIKKHKFAIGGLWISTTIMMQYWLFGSNGYAHYGLLCFPALCVQVNETGAFIQGKKYLINTFIICFVCFGMLVYGLRIQRTISYSRIYPIDESQELIDMIPISDRNSIVMYNCSPELYYYNDIKPDNPYFTLQDFEASRGTSLKKRIYYAFETRNSKWILYKSLSSKSIIKDILRRKYHRVKKSGNYNLYMHN